MAGLLATEIGDPYLQATALNYSGLATVEHGHPNDGLKMLQFAHVIAGGIASDDQCTSIDGVSARAVVQACGLAYSATALAHMGDPDGAGAKLVTVRELWQSTPADLNGDPDHVARAWSSNAGGWTRHNRLLRRWESGSQRARTISGILVATIQVQAGEPDGLGLAHGAITGVLRLSSVRARQRLGPLATALESRPRDDHRELARMARQVATTRA